MSQLKRRDVRIKVMQTLFAHQLSQEPIKKVKADQLSGIKELDNIEFSDKLIDLVIKNEAILDSYILNKVVNWELERMALVDKIILRMGVAELLYFPDIPPKVSINEAIDISKEYCTRASGKFVNGILDAVLIDLKNENKLVKTGRGLLNSKKKSDPGQNGKAEKVTSKKEK